MTLDAVVGVSCGATILWGTLRGTQRQLLPLLGLGLATLLSLLVHRFPAVGSALLGWTGLDPAYAPVTLQLGSYGGLRLWLAAGPLTHFLRGGPFLAPVELSARLSGAALAGFRSVAVVSTAWLSAGSTELASRPLRALGVETRGSEAVALLAKAEPMLRASVPEPSKPPPSPRTLDPIDVAQKQARAYELGAAGRAQAANDIVEGRAEGDGRGAPAGPRPGGDMRPKPGSSNLPWRR